MKTVFLASFLKDVKKLRDAKVRRAVERAIENVEDAKSLAEVQSIKRLSGHQNYYRIRIGDWRVGLKVEADTSILKKLKTESPQVKCLTQSIFVVVGSLRS